MRKIRQTELPRFDSMQQAAAATFIPLAVIKCAKAQGCPAFVGSRVDLAPLLKFLFQPDGTTTALDLPTLQAEQIQLQNEKLTAQNAILRREWVSAADLRTWGAELGAACKKVVESLHLTAPNLAGMTVPEISAALKRSETEILQQFTALGDKIERHEKEARHDLFQPAPPKTSHAAMKKLFQTPTHNPQPTP